MKLYIITGASRGLGAALTEALMAPDHRLVCMARGKAQLAALRIHAKGQGCKVDAKAIDLGNAGKAVAALEAALARLDPAKFRSVCLINNAGTVEPIHTVDKLQAGEIAAAVAINLTAPLALTAAFLRLTSTWQAERKILNISSGAAHKAYAGWGVYCATKAALDHFSRCLALEQQGQPNGAKVVALAPGVIDTDMQAAVRRAAPDDFAELPRFVALKESGQLPTPREAAQRLLRYLARDDFGATPVDDVRNG